jgi:hypothetical protein
MPNHKTVNQVGFFYIPFRQTLANPRQPFGKQAVIFLALVLLKAAHKPGSFKAPGPYKKFSA